MDTPAVINRFADEHFFLSNFSLSPIRINLLGEEWVFATGEHAFQVAKIAACDAWNEEKKLDWVRDMARSTEPNQAKYMGRSITIDRARWNRISYATMQRVQELKYGQNYDLAKKLIATAPATLIEGNTWGDTLWGQVNGKGKNQLGIILMDLRKRLMFERLIDSAWGLMVEQQAGPGNWSMAKDFAWNDLREAFEPFRADSGDTYDLNKIIESAK